MTAPTDDPVERLLATALRDVRTDERWAVHTAPGLAHRVRRAAVRRRRSRVLLAVAAGLAVVGGGTAVLSQVAGDEPRTDRIYAESPAPTVSPVAGISPDFVPDEGRDWLLSQADYDAFASAHVMPSSRPHTAASPAPLTDYSARLLADVEAALPAGTTTERQDALDGDPAAAGVAAVLPDGTPVQVRREPLQTPLSYEDWYMNSAAAPVPPPQAVPGSDSALLPVPEVGYGWLGGIPDGARAVLVVRRDGEVTTWNAPLSVPLETVTQWALAAEAAGR